jgi:hypothetical protein
MPPVPPHTDWLVNTNQTIQTVNGIHAEVWNLEPAADEAVLSAWAKHFRQHYCSDDLIDELCKGTGLTRAAFLTQMKFPDAKAGAGPAIRSGDFAEILIADFIEFKLGFWCPRELRYDAKWNRNESTKGCDVIGFKFVAEGEVRPGDELFVFEVKAKLTGVPSNRLQDAVNGSIEDKVREAITLSALKQRFLERRDSVSADKVERFQQMSDRPFSRINGAAAVLSDNAFDAVLLSQTATDNHPYAANLRLIVVKGPALMDLVHALYDRARDEA